MSLFFILFSVFGALLGSFTNVVILRMAKGHSVIFPPSSCPRCNHQLSPFDLVPVVSWLWLRGSCRYCKAPISSQYPIIESIVATIVGGTFYRLGFSPVFIANAAWGVIFLVVTVIYFRNEVSTKAPFLWPIPITIGFMLQSGTPELVERLSWATIIALASSMIILLMGDSQKAVPWFGVSYAVVISTQPEWQPFLGLGLILFSALSALQHLKIPNSKGSYYCMLLLSLIILGWGVRFGFFP